MEELFIEFGKNEYAIQELESQLEYLYRIRIELKEKIAHGINGQDLDSQGGPESSGEKIETN